MSDLIKRFEQAGLMGCFNGTGVNSTNYKEILDGEKMTKCTESGCRNLEWKCADCGRIASTATIAKNPGYGEWISIKDRVPSPGECKKDNGWFLVMSPTAAGRAEMSRYDKYEDPSYEHGWKYWWGNTITHWMPLPDNPHD